jgi:hypothetical protein
MYPRATSARIDAPRVRSAVSQSATFSLTSPAVRRARAPQRRDQREREVSRWQRIGHSVAGDKPRTRSAYSVRFVKSVNPVSAASTIPRYDSYMRVDLEKTRPNAVFASSQFPYHSVPRTSSVWLVRQIEMQQFGGGERAAAACAEYSGICWSWRADSMHERQRRVSSSYNPRNR